MDNYITTVHVFSGCVSAYSVNTLLYILYQSDCIVYDLEKRETVRAITLPGYQGVAVGADADGRVIIAATKDSETFLLLYSSSGKLLSETKTEQEIYSFQGFERHSGNFFMEVPYNWRYWGYDHPGHAVMMGKK